MMLRKPFGFDLLPQGAACLFGRGAGARAAASAMGICLALCLPMPALAQDLGEIGAVELPFNAEEGEFPLLEGLAEGYSDNEAEIIIEPTETVNEGPPVVQGLGVVLRTLDKSLGSSSDIELGRGEAVAIGRIELRLIECRYPEADPASEAYAHLQVRDVEGQEIFNGWMIASSPALSALEHPRYDVWVLRCITS